MYEYSLSHLFLAVLPGMWYRKPKQNKKELAGRAASCDHVESGRAGGTVFIFFLFNLVYAYLILCVGLVVSGGGAASDHYS